MKKFFEKIFKNLLTKKKKNDIINLSKERKEINAMTKREMFDFIATLNADYAEVVAFCQHEIELLDNRKGSAKTSMTATQKDNVKIKEAIVEALRNADEPMTVTDILNCGMFAEKGYSNQKFSALLKQLKDASIVEKIMDKKKAYFALAE